MKNVFIITIIHLILSTAVFGQSMQGDQKKMLNEIRRNLGSANIMGGATGSFMRFDDGQGRKMNLTPLNMNGVYVGYSFATPSLDRSKSFYVDFNMDGVFGVRRMQSPDSYNLIADSVSLFNFKSYSGYFFHAPLKISLYFNLSKHFHWAIGGGGYLGVPFMAGTLKNGNKSKELGATISYTDLGYLISTEFGIRGAYISIDYTMGRSNIWTQGSSAPNGSIENIGSVYLSVGYRFLTDLGKSDANRIRNLR